MIEDDWRAAREQDEASYERRRAALQRLIWVQTPVPAWPTVLLLMRLVVWTLAAAMLVAWLRSL